MNNEIAILVAAGKGERMRPLTNETPKPLIKVLGTPMIETIINGLNRRGISKIYIVVGYLKEKFLYLTQKYKNIELIENKEYDFKNNISSLYAALDILGTTDCIITDGDLYVSDPSIFNFKCDNSCAFGKFHNGKTDEWCYRCKENRIFSFGPGGNNEYMMGGITYLKKNDAIILANAIEEAYKREGYENLFWDNILEENLDKIYLTINPLENEQIVELDSVKELQLFDLSYNSIKL